MNLLVDEIFCFRTGILRFDLRWLDKKNEIPQMVVKNGDLPW